MAKMIIDGTEYPELDLASLTIGESRIMKRYTGVAGQALQDLDNADPDLAAAMIHITFLRENPAQSFAAVEKRVDAVQWSQIDFTVDPEVEEVEADPPSAPKPKLVESSDSSSGDGARTPSSGTPSTETSENSAEIPVVTGTPI